MGKSRQENEGRIAWPSSCSQSSLLDGWSRRRTYYWRRHCRYDYEVGSRFLNSFKECGMQKQRSCYKPLILTVRFAPLYGPNLKKKLFHLTDSVKISSLSGNTLIKDTPSKKLRNCMDTKAEFCIFRFVRKEILL